MSHRAKVVLSAATAAVVGRVGLEVGTELSRIATARRDGSALEPDVPATAVTTALAAAIALDALVALPMPALSSMGTPEHYRQSSAELDAAVRYYRDEGWLDDPRLRHPAPTVCPDVRTESSARRSPAQRLSFGSGWTPQQREPGAARWQSFGANSTVPVTVFRHAGGPRPWLVAVHGQGMGRASDVRMLRARRLHHELGINVALPVLPLHGPRAAGFAPDRQFVSNVYPINNVLGLTQAVWDMRRLLLWLRDDQKAKAVGVLGISLGSYVCSLLSTVESDLACVVAVVPPSDLAASLRAVEPVIPSRARLHRELHDNRSTLIHKVVAPLAAPCLVPKSQRYIVAGQVDAIAHPSSAAQLWRHWERPAIDWRPAGHLTTWQSKAYERHLVAILSGQGLTE